MLLLSCQTKHKYVMRFILAFSLLLSAVCYANNTRQSELINFDWKFSKGDIPGAEKKNFDDSKWQTVQLPHDASISGPFVEDSLNSDRRNGFLPRQKGWYRKSLILDKISETEKIFLEFEGIYRDAYVYVNEKQVDHQLNGYESFLVDITDEVSAGANLIAVKYDNTDMGSSRWYNGEGIYRDVHLIRTGNAHIDYHGTYITTPFICNDKANVEIHTDVVNEWNSIKEVTLKSEIYSPDQKKVGEIIHTAPLDSGEIYTFNQKITITSPLLWDLDAPNIYKINSTVIVSGEVSDTYVSTFGIRTITFDTEKGLLLNNKKVLVKGVNMHHDLGPLGAAAFERGYERRLEGLKKLGCNAVRLSHNPHDTYILDWCDRNGMLILDEAFDKWQDQFFGEGNSFEDHWESSLTAFIKRDRNHPCIFLWSVGNETQQQKSPRYDFGVPQLKKMVSLVHNLEPSRGVTCGLHPSRKSGAYRTPDYYREGPPEMVFYMDVVSTNYREEFWPMDKKNYPQLIFLLSESQSGNLGNEWFNFNHESSVGLFYWGGTDYIGESFGWPSKGWPNGIIDWDDHWKPFSYYIQSLFSEEPMVHVTAYDPQSETTKYWNEIQLRYQPMYSHWNWKGKDSIKVLTMSNGQEVELYLNNKSLGTKKVPAAYYDKKITSFSAEEYDPENPRLLGPEIYKELEWNIPYQEGVIRAESKINGKVVAVHELVTTGEAYSIHLEADRDKIKSNGLDLSYITIKIVDKNGLTVPDADHNVQFKIKGAGSIAGVGSADITSNESFVSNQRKVFQGKALLIIRSSREAGKIQIEATANGLKSAKLTITSE